MSYPLRFAPDCSDAGRYGLDRVNVWLSVSNCRKALSWTRLEGSVYVPLPGVMKVRQDVHSSGFPCFASRAKHGTRRLRRA